MSIATVGQAKYEYQDLVCLEFVLRFLDASVTCIVEPSGGEDATLQVTLESGRFDIELQVKGAESRAAAVNLPVLAEYLAHFPASRSSGFLLDRLASNDHRVVVLVCTQRATDDCAAFTVLNNWRGELYRDDSITLDSARQLLAAIKSTKCDGKLGSPLRQAREENLRTFAASASVPRLRRALQRLKILDRWGEEDVRRSLEYRLRIQLGIAVDLVGDVQNRLLKCLISAKASGTDVVPELCRILSDAKSPSITPRAYVERGQEKAWCHALSRDRVLLLSGPPRCGKSDAACWIGAQLAREGFSPKRTGSLEHAERVLLDESSGSAVVVLDDPLGAMYKDDATVLRALHHLEQLMFSVPGNRRLVVAQSQEPLLAATRTQRLSDVKTAGYGWIDLGVFTSEFLQDVWHSCVTIYSVPENLKELVANGLRSARCSWAPGVLSHIAANSEGLVDPASASDVERLAQQSATQFGATLASSQDSESLLAALAIGTSELEAVPEPALAFILGEGGAVTKPSALMSSICFGGESKQPSLPDYESQPALPSNAKGELIKLERHRVVFRAQDHSVLFSHPFYRAAARSVVERSTVGQREDVLNAVRRGLFSLSPLASAAVARNLPWLYMEVGSTLGIDEELVRAAKEGLKSYFLTTRDLCYRFLVRIAHESPKTYGHELPAWVNSIKHVDINGIAWRGKSAFVPVGMSRSGMELLTETRRVPPEEDVAHTLAAMEAGKTLPEMRDAVELLRFFRGHPERLSSKILSRFFSYDEGVVRAEAAKLWLGLDRENDEELLGRLARDTHPLVAGKVCRTSLLAWSKYSDARKAEVLGLLNGYGQQPETAAVMLDEALRLFGDDEWLSDKPWDAYPQLIPNALRAFPVGFRLSADRLYVTARQALKRMPAEQALLLASAWVEWLQRQLDFGQLPDDYALGVWAAIVGTANFPVSERHSLLEELLSFTSTGCALVFVADVVDDWHALTAEEQGRVLAVLGSDRTDVVWLRAAAVTRGEVPPEVQRAVLGAEDVLSWAPDRLVEQIPASLLHACVQLHSGNPQPLWYLGKHHGSETWKSVVAHTARRPAHPLFAACFIELIRDGDEHELNSVVTELAASHAFTAFEILIDRMVGVTNEWHREAVDMLLQASDAQTLAKMQSHMVAKAPAILDGVSDIGQWTSHKPTQRALLAAFATDAALLMLLNRLQNDSETGLSDDDVMVVLRLLREKRPTLHHTYGEVQDGFKEARASQSIVDEVDIARRAAVDAKYAAINAMKHDDLRELPNWMGIPF